MQKKLFKPALFRNDGRTSLPFLNIGEYEHSSHGQTSNFISRLKKDRHRQSHILQLRMCVSHNRLAKGLVKGFISYAIEHNLENLSLELKYKHLCYKLSTLSSPLLKKLTLGVKLEDFESLPHLTTLRLSKCSRLSSEVWNFPALLILELDELFLPHAVMFSKLVNLQNLTLSKVKIPYISLSLPQLLNQLVNLQNLTLSEVKIPYISLSLPQLLNLNMRTSCFDSNSCIYLSTPKLCNFTSVGIFSINLKAPELKNVSMKLQGWFANIDRIYRKHHYRRFQYMLSQVDNAKNFTFDLESIEALSATSNDLASKPSPFNNLNYVKLPHNYNESSLPVALRNYLLGGSSRGTIVTTLPQNTISQ